jgi:phenylacetate-CoA ligase
MLNPYLKLFYKAKAIKSFDEFDAGYFSRLLVSEEPAFWQKAGEKMALSLFRSASRRVPAYVDFLEKRKVNPEKIKTIGDFKHLPVTTKENYFKKYPLEDLCWDGNLEKNDIFSVSSGSSGAPFFWPRGKNLELETAISHELFLRDIFGIDKQKTLFIVTFSMGIYIAGVITASAVSQIAQKGYPLVVITPGINMDEILRIAREMSPKFSQTIIAGYPPFVKDVIERGEGGGID